MRVRLGHWLRAHRGRVVLAGLVGGGALAIAIVALRPPAASVTNPPPGQPSFTYRSSWTFPELSRALGAGEVVAISAASTGSAVEGPGGTGTAVLYLDGPTVDPQVRGTASNATVFANFDPALAPGRHTVVVFASDGAEAAAGAWAFTVVKR